MAMLALIFIAEAVFFVMLSRHQKSPREYTQFDNVEAVVTEEKSVSLCINEIDSIEVHLRIDGSDIDRDSPLWRSILPADTFSVNSLIIDTKSEGGITVVVD